MGRSGSGRTGPLSAFLVVVALAVAGCAGSAQAQPSAPARVTSPHPAPHAAPRVSVRPVDGTIDAAPADPIRVTAVDGVLSGVTLTSADGTAVAGTVAADGRTWTATAPLDFDTTYRLTGSARGAGGTTPVTGRFTTVDPDRLVHASTGIGDGAVVGVAAPIEIRFDRPVPDSERPAAERALSVTTTPAVTGSWAWLPDTADGSRVHWRPRVYWPAGTTVDVAARLYGVDLGRAGFGAADLTTTFTVGRAQIVRADARSHRIVVLRDGRTVLDLPASYGLENDPRRVTRSGVHVVMGKAQTVLMSNPDYGYDKVPEHWAVRISNNGEFIHANPATDSVQGRRNITHGCINLSTKNARAYYDTAMFGDPVEITGTRVALSAADGDIYDWAVPWATWTTMSALA